MRPQLLKGLLVGVGDVPRRVAEVAGRLLRLEPEDDYALFRCGAARYGLGDEMGLDLIAKAYRTAGEDVFEEEDPRWRELLVARGDIAE